VDPFLNSGSWFDNHWYQTLGHQQPRARLSSGAVLLVALVAALVGGAAMFLGDRAPPPTDPTVALGQRLLIRM